MADAAARYPDDALCAQTNRAPERTTPMTGLNIDYTPQPWMEHGNCLTTETDMTPDRLFVTGRTKGRPSPEVIAAKAVCKGCPVATQCLTFAIETEAAWGVWGGLTHIEIAELAGREPLIDVSLPHPQRDKTHCSNNHEYTEENTRIDQRGWRTCRACDRGRSKRSRNRKDAA